MTRPFSSLRGLTEKTDLILMGICVLLALAFFGLAASNLTMAGNFISIDSLFLTLVGTLVGLIFLSIPLMTLHERGMLKNPFAIGEGIPPARAREGAVHFEGSTRLFLFVLGGLLFITLIEVYLGYIQLSLYLMLTILIGLSLIKAAMIMAYFMHLRFERMSLVLTLVPVLVVCICLLLIFFPDSRRSHDLRPPQSAAASSAEQPAGAEH
jgi:cytochrome c oxidase subunit IV